MIHLHHEQLFYNEEKKVLDLFFEDREVIKLKYKIKKKFFMIVPGKLFQPTPSFPALQFLDSIEKGSNADKAGLKQNDYVLQVIENFGLFFFN